MQALFFQCVSSSCYARCKAVFAVNSNPIILLILFSIHPCTSVS